MGACAQSAGLLPPWNDACSRMSTPSMRTRKIQIWTSVFVGLGWLAVLALGVRGLLNYESAPGTIAEVPKTWPASQVPLARDRMTLVMLAHPHCPCTRASVSELAEVMARIQDKADAYVLFSTPADASSGGWEDTGLRRSAAAIPGVTVLSDADGAEARRFGAETSGHTLLFAADGRLLFSGGITQSRGHAGDNAGASAIAALVNNEIPARAETFVFGCSLRGTESAAPTAVASR